MITLKFSPCDEVAQIIIQFMDTEPGVKEIFYGKQSRVISSAISALILLDDNPIGFMCLVEERVPNVLFLDMGIKEKYRGQGYGKKAMDELLKCLGDDFDDYIIGETKNTNLLSNGMAEDIAGLVYQHNDLNYHIFPKSKRDEFLNSDSYEKFKNHCSKVLVKKVMMNQYYH